MDGALAESVPGRVAQLLEVTDLRVDFASRGNIVNAVQGVSLSVARGETLGVVGESGSGKSVTALAMMGLVPSPGRVIGGSIRWEGTEIDDFRSLRGRKMTMIFQDPMTSLNPLVSVGRQITEVIAKHLGFDRKAARERGLELMSLVGIPSPKQRFSQFPFEFSGGMRQRIMIAIALAPEPDLLIADEPTTALDVTIQAQILELIAGLQERLKLSMILITHDLGIIAGVCKRVVVMYGGRVMEEGSADGIFHNPSHPYTAGLLASTPRLDIPLDRLVPVPGNPPTVLRDLELCPFNPRCERRQEDCVVQRPPLDPLPPPIEPDRRAACLHPLV
jgi:peptide/nickel transport system ATP-binding protein